MNQTQRPAPAIACQGVSLRADSRTVLDGIDLAIPPGAVVGLVGRNGAGKSTLMRCLVGLAVPDAGSCQLLGCDSAALDDHARQRLGYVSQTGDLLSWLSVRQHVDYIGSFYPRWRRDEAAALCLRFGLADGQKVSALSVGDQQKLALVLALAHDPDLVILDEPVASLDPMTRREFMRLMFDADGQRATPRTVLFSSHLLSDLQRVVTHLVFLREGRVQLQGGWDELQEHLLCIDDDPGSAAGSALLHRRLLPGGGLRCVVDLRQAQAGSRTQWVQAGRPLALEDLFVELNS